MKHITTTTILLLTLFLLISAFSALSPPPPPPPQPPSIACKSTIYPKLCRTLLKSYNHSPTNPNGYTKFTIKQSLKHAKKLSKIITHFLQTHKKSPLLTSMQRNALYDCAQLTETTVDYLTSIATELKSLNNDVVIKNDDELVGKIQTLLSAVVTNQQTCYDGLNDGGGDNVVSGGLFSPLLSGSELYSVALGLVSHALGRVRKGRKGGGGAGGNGGDWDDHVPSSSMFTKVLHASNETRKGGRLLEEMVDGGVHCSDSVTVSLYGGGNFTSISDAIAFAPNNSVPENSYFVIYVKQGYYEEYVVVPKHKNNIMLLGDGINSTVIAGNRSVLDGWTTFRSATFAVSGERFVAIGITFVNVAGPAKHQAVAVRNSADLSTFYRCSFIGYQDTLYVHSLRQFYRECDVYGTVDFIFGNAAAVFQNCNLYARKPMPNQKNAFIAQSRSDPNQNTGISIQNCTIQAAPDLAMDLNSTQTFLGRPWKEYSRTVYMQSYIGDLIDPAGWLEWNATTSLDKMYYGEYGNYGPGSNTTMRVQWPGYSLMNASEAMNFTVYNLTMGDTWLPYTSIPFSAGLE